MLYEVVWTRLLTLELGHTTASASAVLAAFMGGLAFGALAGGFWTRRLAPRAGLRAYAALEIAIGTLALAVPLEISAIHPLLALAYGDGPGGPLFQLLRLSAAILIVGLPATLMGATYPLVIVDARAAGSLYAANTAGAAAGALGAGFAALPLLGLWKSTLLGVAGNGLVALIAWRLARGADELPRLERDRGRRAATVAPSRSPLPLALLATAVAGYAALSLELVWTRTLAMVMGPTTYAFSTTVACFIIGLAAGSAGASWLLRARGQRARPEAWLAVALGLGALATGWAVGGVDDFVIAVAHRTVQPGIGYTRLVVAEFVDAARLVVPPAVAFGAAFPLAIAVAKASTARHAGWVYAANTAGAVGGSLVTAGLVIPAVGLHGAFVLAAALIGAMSLVMAVSGWSSARATALAAVVVAVAAGARLVATGWHTELLSSGAYKYAPYVGEQDLEARLAAGTLRYYREGATGTVAVRDLAGVRALSIDGKVDASNGGDMLTQRLLAHVPLLLNPAAQRIAIIGLGSGVTLGSALTHPVRHADVIEISPEVVEASSWFSYENRNGLRDQRVRLVLGDARTHFRLSSSRYDIVISEPSNPWMAGVAALFTREFFETLRTRLAPGGVVCQWAHTYDIAANDLKSIVATFISVFPNVSIWLVGGGDLLLVGAERPLPEQLPELAVPADARQDLEASGVTSLAVLEQLRLGDGAFARRWAGTAAFQSDDRMALEFSAPAATVGASREDNAEGLLLARTSGAAPQHAWSASGPARQVDPRVVRDVGLLALRSQAPARAWEALSEAANRLPDDRATLNGLVRAAGMSDSPVRLAAAESLLRSLVASRPAAITARLELARLLASRGSFQEAQDVARGAEQAAPDNVDVQEELAGIAADAEDASGLGAAVGRLRALRPAGGRTLYFEAVARMLSGHPGAAVPLARAAVAADPQHAPSWNLLGSALGSTNASADEIRHAFARAIEADPSDPTAYVNLGTLELSSGRAALAANWFAQALTVSPGHEGARQGLAAARSAPQ